MITTTTTHHHLLPPPTTTYYNLPPPTTTYHHVPPPTNNDIYNRKVERLKTAPIESNKKQYIAKGKLTRAMNKILQ